MARTLTPERQGLKLEALRLRKRGHGPASIAQRQGVPVRTVKEWLKGKNWHVAIVAPQGSAGNNPPTWIVAPCPIEEYRPPEGVSFPLIIADPPWGVSRVGRAISRTRKKAIIKDFGSWDTLANDQTYYAQLKDWLTRLYEVAATDAWLVLFHAIVRTNATTAIAEAAGWRYRIHLYWAKSNAHPVMGGGFTQAVEPALVLAKGKPRFSMVAQEQVPNVFSFPIVTSTRRFKDSDGDPFNRAEKPIALLRLWVEYLSQPGDWVLDAFAGSGACAEAAVQLGRNVVAVEAEEAQCKAIEARLLRLANGTSPRRV